jgi:hypothetical protein
MLRYDPETGVFYWRKKTSKKTVIGKEAGGKNVAGYIVIGIAGKIYYAHRLAWIYMTGNCPSQVDHADNVKTNNRWKNLRAATHQQNVLNAKRAKNNTSGRKGVTWHKAAKKWSASIFLNGKPNYLGLFNCPDEAHEAYMNAAIAAQPDFARSE